MLFLLLAAHFGAGAIVAAPAPPPPAAAKCAPAPRVRRAILDALRPPVERDLKQKVVFVVRTLRVTQGWAFVDATPRRPHGGAVSLKGTPFAELAKWGVYGGDACALLRLRKNRWVIVARVMGPTDVAWENWDKEYGAPRAVFP